jgi:GTP-binding protein LepA
MHVRVVDGELRAGVKLHFLSNGVTLDAAEVGVFTPRPRPVAALGPGQVGYLQARVKDAGRVRIGDTLTAAEQAVAIPVAQYRTAVPMVFAGLYPADSDDAGALQEAISKLALNDPALRFKPEVSNLLGVGYRCG